MTTWKTLEECERAVRLMLQGNPYYAWAKSENGGQTYRPCYDLAELTSAIPDIHQGNRTLGLYAIRQDDRTRWGAIDYDDHDGTADPWFPDLAVEAFEEAKKVFDEVWLLKSPPNNYHVVCFMNDLRPASEIRAILHKIEPDPDVEKFPKQDQIDRSKPKAKGSLLRFPGMHPVRGVFSEVLKTHGRITNVKVAEPEPPSEESHWNDQTELTRLYNQTTRRLVLNKPGQRYKAMQKLAGRLKGRATREDAITIYRRWHESNKANIRTSPEAGLHEFLVWFDKAEPCNLEIPAYPLDDAEFEKMHQLRRMLGSRGERTFRAAQFALNMKKHADAKGLDPFFFSLRKLAEHLNLRSAGGAAKHRDHLIRWEIIVKIKIGGHGSANEYRLGRFWTTP